MGFATVYCDKCGSQVLGAEIEKGHAVARGDKFYCAECAPSLPPEAPGTHHDKKGSTKVRRPGDSPRNTDIIKNLQAMGGGRGNTTRVAAIAPQETGGMGTGAKAGLTVGGIAVLALIGFIVSQMGGSGGGGGNTTKPDNSRARASYEAADSLRNSANPKAWVEAAQKARRDATGTEYEEKATAMAREAQEALAAYEKSEAIYSEIKRTAADARAAEDPMTYEPAFRDVIARARKDAPKHLAMAESTWNEIVQGALLKPLNKIDISLAATPAGYRRVKDDLDEVAKKATAAGPAGKTALASVEKKQKEALEKFQASADSAYAEFEKRVTQMLADSMVEEADRAVTMFANDYTGTPVAAKANALKEKVAARKKELDAGWIEAVESDWRKELGEMKATWSGREISFVCDGPAGAGVDHETDKSRKITFAKADDSWKDYDVEFEVNIEAYGGLLVMRSSGRDPHPFNFVPTVGNQPGLPTGQWFKINMRLKGNAITVSGPSIPSNTYTTTSTSGSFSFIGFKGSKFKIRNVRVRKLK
ncbi:MAG: hypothetical protein FD180_1659 [Planctomycetota bacterium]|nr:MAG: hypothetical protein FD180_1659 [Planctomycetota bacterium]